MLTVYLRIPYIDRVGIVHDISLILARRETNIISMEVQEGIVFLECQDVLQEQRIEFIEELGSISGVQEIVEISLCHPKDGQNN